MHIARRSPVSFCLALLIGLTLSSARASAQSTAPASGPRSAPVTLKDEGNDVVLSNGLITAVLSKSGASIRNLRFAGHEMLNAGYYSMDGGANFRTPKDCRYQIVKNTPDHVEVKMTRVWKDEPQAFDIEIHYALRRGDTGLYTYALLHHTDRHPATSYGEWRMVWKLNGDLLEKICVDEKRHFQMQNSKDTFERTPIAETIKLTSGVRAGQYDCKYDYSASYYDLGCWGHASDVNKVGAFIVLGSKEFFNDGPMKQDLNAASGINHIHFGMNHYNSSTVKLDAGERWTKMYGPFLLYVNKGESAKACWDDAKARVAREHAAWPYEWVNNPHYPKAAERGVVTGKLAIVDALRPSTNAAGAWVGLAAPDPGGNWQFESERYQFWTRAEPDGTFKIPHVRAGKYTLYAFNTGAVGEFSRADIEVAPGQTLALGDITWQVPNKGKTLAWEIGIPDRTAKEFHGGDHYFQAYLWEKFHETFANPLVYTVGKSTPDKDWNYAQTRYPTDDGRFVPHEWQVKFDLASRPAGPATLTLAIASAQRARIELRLNGKRLPDVSPSVQGGNALLRHGIHAKYCVEYVTIPPEMLNPGSNTLSLSLPSTRTADQHVMYDYISLELP